MACLPIMDCNVTKLTTNSYISLLWHCDSRPHMKIGKIPFSPALWLPPPQSTNMSSKEASYLPLMSPTSFTYDESSSDDEEVHVLWTPTWRRLVLSPILGILFSLVVINIIFISVVMARMPTNMQCTKKLNLFCMHAYKFDLTSYTYSLKPRLSKLSSTLTEILSTTSMSAAYTEGPLLRSEKSHGIS